MGSKKAPRKAVDTVVSALLPRGLELLSSTQIAVLWSSYGHIYRLAVRQDGEERSMVLKHISPPHTIHASLSHARKLISYAVERYFYQHLAALLPGSVAVAKSHPTIAPGTLLLDDLEINFPRPAYGSLGADATSAVLHWLAGFHATFWGQTGHIPPPLDGQSMDSNVSAQGVWEQGTYWYLDTRREELAEIDESGESGFVLPWVEKINGALAAERASGRTTLLHGDAKGENIHFSRHGACAFVDFQYVGSGPPTLDLMYFIGTSIEERLLRGDGEQTLLRQYFDALRGNLGLHPGSVDEYSYEHFLRQWDLAIVDWYRFMAGWGFWGNDRWIARRAREIVQRWERDGFP